jgi:hypothetical protein
MGDETPRARMWEDPRTNRLWAVSVSAYDPDEASPTGRALLTFSAAGESFTAWSHPVGLDELTDEGLQALLDEATGRE